MLKHVQRDDIQRLFGAQKKPEQRCFPGFPASKKLEHDAVNLNHIMLFISLWSRDVL
jgi:hypothetical protein